ncbi:MAG: DUF2007 domain-containing protein [Pirellulales bacterium]
MPTELVTVRRCINVNEAELAKMLLEAEGIRAYLADATFVSMDWLLGNAVGWIKVQVADNDADGALAILRGGLRLDASESNDDDNQPPCPPSS